ncbi:hypothetical protein P4O66_009810 [Electrophorus voltai]|uniref:Uncharacterized protein n=1 Tax=Electrophorus voltai TaxID=2609070 RepID=A0AAD8ZCF2_9TELE|nr:hypothetical protein P4O66_009810 [Electrophorus voltai]
MVEGGLMQPLFSKVPLRYFSPHLNVGDVSSGGKRLIKASGLNGCLATCSGLALQAERLLIVRCEQVLRWRCFSDGSPGIGVATAQPRPKATRVIGYDEPALTLTNAEASVVKLSGISVAHSFFIAIILTVINHRDRCLCWYVCRQYRQAEQISFSLQPRSQWGGAGGHDHRVQKSQPAGGGRVVEAAGHGAAGADEGPVWHSPRPPVAVEKPSRGGEGQTA